MQLRRCSCHAHYSAVTVVSRGVPTIPITVQLSKPQQLPSSANLVSCRNPVTQICATVHQVFSSHTPHDLSTADSNQPPPLPSKHLLPHTHTDTVSGLDPQSSVSASNFNHQSNNYQHTIWFMTGHNTMNRHLTLFKRKNDALCPLCEEERETSLHFLRRCSATMIAE